MHRQESETQEDKAVPGTIIDSDDQPHAFHISHCHRYSLNYTPPSLVEVSETKPIRFDRTELLLQLHIHLDGSFRHSTLFELAQEKGNDDGAKAEMS